VLGIAALRAGSSTARFFVISNGVVSLAAAFVLLSNLRHYDSGTIVDFVWLMCGQVFEGWVLFGALAYRLRSEIGAHTEAERLAGTDALTGIGNRRTFDTSIGHEWERSTRAGTPLALLLLDIDYFKRFNDTYGHVAGDDCLRRVAAAMRASATRPADVCARYGGEEFAAVLGETDLRGALAVGEEMVAAVRRLAIAHQGCPNGIVTVSIGAASTLPAPGQTPGTLVAASDAALYRAKEEGRNRVVANPPSPACPAATSS